MSVGAERRANGGACGTEQVYSQVDRAPFGAVTAEVIVVVQLPRLAITPERKPGPGR